MLVQASKIVDLAHRAYLVSPTPTESLVLVASSDGQISIIDADRKIEELSKTKPFTSISLHPCGKFYASIDAESGRMQMKNFSGLMLAEFEASKLLPCSSPLVRRAFDSCFFTRSGLSLLTTAHVSEHTIVVEHFEIRVEDDRPIASRVSIIDIKDSFSTSHNSFYSEGNNLFPLWIAAGQNGQQICWLSIEKNNQLKRLDMPAPSNSTPPQFSPDKESFVVLDNHKVSTWSVSQAKQIGSSSAQDERDPFVESMCFVSDDCVIAATHSGRIFAIDTNSMSVADEIVLAEHEPRPANIYFPRVQSDKLCTNISFFRSIGSSSIFVHRRDKGHDLAGWCDSLTIVDNKAIEELGEKT